MINQLKHKVARVIETEEQENSREVPLTQINATKKKVQKEIENLNMKVT